MEQERRMPRIQPNRIRAAQFEMNKTNEQMAALLGIAPSSYGNKLAGLSNWTRSDIEMLVFITGHSFDYFYGI